MAILSSSSKGWLQGIFIRVSSPQPMTNRFCIKTKYLSRLSDFHGDSIYHYRFPGAPIQNLFSFGRPPNITGLISLVVVNSVKRVVRGWPSPNMIKERLERGFPFWAHFNPSASVVLPVFQLRIPTSVKCLLPSSMFRSAFVPDRLPVSYASSTRGFSDPVTAGLRIPGSKIPSSNDLLFPAIAEASPHYRAPSVLHSFKDKKKVETLSGVIYKCAHEVILS